MLKCKRFDVDKPNKLLVALLPVVRQFVFLPLDLVPLACCLTVPPAPAFTSLSFCPVCLAHLHLYDPPLPCPIYPVRILSCHTVSTVLDFLTHLSCLARLCFLSKVPSVMLHRLFFPLWQYTRRYNKKEMRLRCCVLTETVPWL
jgi:hypothetical protein